MSSRADERKPAKPGQRKVEISAELDDRHTGLRIEPEFVKILTECARETGISRSQLLRQIDRSRGSRLLIEAVRVWALRYSLQRCAAIARGEKWVPPIKRQLRPRISP